jgi:hypothetical protein
MMASPEQEQQKPAVIMKDTVVERSGSGPIILETTLADIDRAEEFKAEANKVKLSSPSYPRSYSRQSAMTKLFSAIPTRSLQTVCFYVFLTEFLANIPAYYTNRAFAYIKQVRFRDILMPGIVWCSYSRR